MDLHELRESLRKLRAKRGLTQAEVADLAEVKPSYISHLEGKREDVNPTVGALSRIFGALDARLDFFLIGAGVDRPKDAETRALYDQLLRALPHLDDDAKQTLRSLLKSWKVD